MDFQKYLSPCALDESSLSIGMVNQYSIAKADTKRYNIFIHLIAELDIVLSDSPIP